MISNVEFAGLESAVKASGYPMSVDVASGPCVNKPDDYKRAKKLAKAKAGSGHDCFLKGIVVMADVTAPQYWWPQFQRYHFADIISSQSKMHRLTKMNIAKQCNKYVSPVIVKIMNELIEEYNRPIQDPNSKHRNYMRIVSNCPMGLNLTARCVFNYLQLKTMYYQRRGHKLPEWQLFCTWIENLPYFREWILDESR